MEPQFGNKFCPTSFHLSLCLEKDSGAYLVVEDEIQVLMLAESVLQQAGHDTVCASTEPKPSSIQSMKSLIWSSPTWS